MQYLLTLQYNTIITHSFSVIVLSWSGWIWSLFWEGMLVHLSHTIHPLAFFESWEETKEPHAVTGNMNSTQTVAQAQAQTTDPGIVG